MRAADALLAGSPGQFYYDEDLLVRTGVLPRQF